MLRTYTAWILLMKKLVFGTFARSWVYLLPAINYGEQLSRLSIFMPGANRVQPVLKILEMMDVMDSLAPYLVVG